MSTSYGTINTRDGGTLEVEAFGISGSVKLLPSLFPMEIAIDDPVQIDKLITLLEIARDHVWKT